MAVMRIQKTKDYTVMSNSHFREPRMSLKAKGLLSLMLSLPDNWDYSIAGLVTLSKDGKDSVMGGLKELEEFGYLQRTRLTDAEGKFAGYDYTVYENPQTEKPCAEKPNTEEPNAENPPQLNTNKSSTKKSKTNKSNTNNKGARFIKPTIEEIRAYCIERKNNVDPERFFDYYEANGWRVGKNPMKDWRASVRTWERNGYSGGASAKNDESKWVQPPEEVDEYPF